ncbi:hypothetical protein [Pseudoxanthomonas koreensis]|uniref:hypothetical protein n=1 Tax=Pseudoxanthomonas koreensis TaxID=266061 RepID=UPI0013918DE0|nr:hypothetical protein [Pseudoxanthomonas koreensis]KAF1694277.1 hypothetical protein CSC64_04470 [Pseudoxanthomonas koreensis]
MFARIAVVAAALAATSPALAAESGIAVLSRETGVSERHIAMVVGARTAYAEYPTTFNRIERELKTALGKEGYRLLQAREIGIAVEIHRARVAAAAAARTQEQATEPRRQTREG